MPHVVGEYAHFRLQVRGTIIELGTLAMDLLVSSLELSI